jgi:thiol-disulfide isomerase/thioredoxin
MGSYYSVLGVDQDASHEALEAAYTRQRERYNPDLVVDLDPELRTIANERSAEIERAFAVLGDPERRRQYDSSLGGAAQAIEGQAAVDRRRLTPRERTFALVGAVVAIALVATIWVLTGRDAGTQAQAMGEVNRPAPAFDVPALAGGSVNLEAYKGQVVLLNFWGTWCEPCKRELPALEAAHQQLGAEGLAIIGVNLTNDELAQGRDQAAIQAYLTQFGVTYPVALDLEGDITNAYHVFPLPTSFFIDGKGHIRYVHIGELTLDDVQARFLELKEEASAARAP